MIQQLKTCNDTIKNTSKLLGFCSYTEQARAHKTKTLYTDLNKRAIFEHLFVTGADYTNKCNTSTLLLRYIKQSYKILSMASVSK